MYKRTNIDVILGLFMAVPSGMFLVFGAFVDELRIPIVAVGLILYCLGGIILTFGHYTATVIMAGLVTGVAVIQWILVPEWVPCAPIQLGFGLYMLARSVGKLQY